ncbi:hypothetical protein [Cyanothece sp. BG0011]|uniref:hypothetical protein n=1 Tax=Cyanothece sp. BG0011 TaxID=2082950 RepID=UPI000D1F24AA|nr:hypothetical protein [Cyanothece sp. BG0011]
MDFRFSPPQESSLLLARSRLSGNPTGVARLPCSFNQGFEQNLRSIALPPVFSLISTCNVYFCPGTYQSNNLKKLCRYASYHITLWHSWVNDVQADKEKTSFIVP